MVFLYLDWIYIETIIVIGETIPRAVVATVIIANQYIKSFIKNYLRTTLEIIIRFNF